MSQRVNMSARFCFRGVTMCPTESLRRARCWSIYGSRARCVYGVSTRGAGKRLDARTARRPVHYTVWFFVLVCRLSCMARPRSRSASRRPHSPTRSARASPPRWVWMYDTSHRTVSHSSAGGRVGREWHHFETFKFLHYNTYIK